MIIKVTITIKIILLLRLQGFQIKHSNSLKLLGGKSLRRVLTIVRAEVATIP